MDATLLELVSRGKKDAYFIQNPQSSLFGTVYRHRNPSAKEVRYQYPTSPPGFNDVIDIEIPHYGDVITRIDITADLPTWIPPELIAVNQNPNFSIYNSWNILPNGIPIPPSSTIIPPPQRPTVGEIATPPLVGYGFVDGIGDILFKKWELYADNYKICEGYPLEFSSWYPYSQTTQNALPVRFQRGAYNRNNTYSIVENATPPQVVCTIPIPGCQREHDTGFPICALQNQRLVLRLYLRSLTELVESTQYYDSSGNAVRDPSGLAIYDPCPVPWNRKPLWIYDISANTTSFAGYSLQLYNIKFPIVAARYSILHLDSTARNDMRSRHLDLYFQKQYVEQIIFDSRNWFLGAQISRTFEIKGFFEFIVLRFQAQSRLQENKYTDLLPPQVISNTPAEWFNDLSLIVNASQRIQPWGPRSLRILANNLQLPTDVADAQYYLMFGQLFGGEPGGNLLLSRTHKVRLNCTVATVTVDPSVTTNQVNLTLVGLSWNVLEIDGSIARIRYPD